MTDCPRGDVRDLLPDLLHDRLDADARAEVERHVARCPECAAELELLRAMRGALSRAPMVDAAAIAAAVARAGAIPAAEDLRRDSKPPTGRVMGDFESPASGRGVGAPRGGRWSRWRAAAGIAIAAGIASWAAARVATHERAPHGAPPATTMASVPAAGSTVAPRGDGDSTGPATRAHAAPPRSGTPSLPRQVARVERGLSVDGGVSDLQD
ncbi:MAG TPA: zf-HC2 domain-containing protein, partial [Gemmatimonadaceae bacterium]|nr:zf-HC2 domain-containing protein [Gemmatimonadaceae bacterium]